MIVNNAPKTQRELERMAMEYESARDAYRCDFSDECLEKNYQKKRVAFIAGCVFYMRRNSASDSSYYDAMTLARRLNLYCEVVALWIKASGFAHWFRVR